MDKLGWSGWRTRIRFSLCVYRFAGGAQCTSSNPSREQVADVVYLCGQFTGQLFAGVDKQACGHEQT